MQQKKIYTEGVFTSLLQMFSFGKIRKELNKLKELETDSDVEQTLKDLKQGTDDLEEQLKRFCRDNPDHAHCKESTGKSRVVGVTK